MKSTKESKIGNRIFIIGIIYGTNDRNKKVIEALSLYDREQKKGYIQSYEKVTQRFINGEPIVGIRMKNDVRYDTRYDDYNINTYSVLDIMKYNYKKLPVLDGSGKVIEPGKDVIIGTKIIDGTEKFVVVNTSYKLRYLSKEEALQEKLLGVIRNTFFVESTEPIEEE